MEVIDQGYVVIDNFRGEMANNKSFIRGLRQRGLTPQQILNYCKESNDIYHHGMEVIGQGFVVIDNLWGEMANNMSFIRSLRQKGLTPQQLSTYCKESNDIYHHGMEVIGQGFGMMNNMTVDMANNRNFLQRLFLQYGAVNDENTQNENFPAGAGRGVLNQDGNNHVSTGVAANVRDPEERIDPISYASSSCSDASASDPEERTLPISSSDPYCSEDELKQPPTKRVKRNSNGTSTASATGSAAENNVEMGCSIGSLGCFSFGGSSGISANSGPVFSTGFSFGGSTATSPCSSPTSTPTTSRSVTI
jgi:hypothetical protein